MKSFKELLAPLRQKELSFATKQWIIIIVSVLIGACLSNWDDYLYRNNDVGRWIGLIGDHHVEGMYRGFQFALAVVLINIISRILKDKRVLKQPKELKAATIIGITALGLFAVVFWIDACYSALHPMSEDDPLLFWARAFFLFILVKVIRTLCDDCKKVVAFFKAQKEPEKPEPKPRLDHSLERFVVAQERMYSRALEEVKNGKKLTHWIWYIFPQLKGLGHSNKSIYYGLDGIEEARAYLAHPLLGARLREITTAVLQSEKSADEIFGGIDTIKLRSCMTLFNEVADDDLFGGVLLKCFEGEGDVKTKMMTNPEVKIDD